ncbi:MAG: chemotaxis protein CheW [Methylococcales bacterium]|nr:chemotaxis protein CheW [Methylococcales bacterium]
MKVSAWIVSITDTVFASVGEFELIHILPDSPSLYKVPKAPCYCQQVFIWQNKIIPVMNLALRFGLEQESATTHRFICIFAYRAQKTGLLEYGALSLNASPTRTEVSDEQVCKLPTDLSPWRHYFRSCFQEANTQASIPILKLECLFAYQEGV